MASLGSATVATPPTTSATSNYLPVVSTTWGAVIPTTGQTWPRSM